MRVLEYDRFGGPIELRDAAPPEPRRGEILVAVRAAALNPKDIVVRQGKYRLASGSRFPMRTGYDWAGEVVGTGERRYGMIQRTRGGGGAAAERIVVRPEESAPMPAGLSFEEAAALPLVGQTALQALRDVARVRGGERVLISGASGGVGTHAVQVARALGCTVTTTSSAGNRALLESLGANEALDHAADDPLRRERAFEVIFDVFGNRSFAAARHALVRGGVYVSTLPKPHIFRAIARTLLSPTRVRLVIVRSRARDLEELTRLVEAGKLRPVVDRVFELGRAPEAFAYLATRHARGKVVLRLAPAS
jgi:NADPH:quinone reductase-like Zn-dependent oxidoreductase